MKPIKKWINSDVYHRWFFNDEEIESPTGKVILADGSSLEYYYETYFYWGEKVAGHGGEQKWSNRMLVKVPFQDTFITIPIERVDVVGVEQNPIPEHLKRPKQIIEPYDWEAERLRGIEAEKKFWSEFTRPSKGVTP